MGPKSKTPGPDGRQKSDLLKKKTQSAGGRVTRSRLSFKKSPVKGGKIADTKTPRKTPTTTKTAAVEDQSLDDVKNAAGTENSLMELVEKPSTPKTSAADSKSAIPTTESAEIQQMDTKAPTKNQQSKKQNRLKASRKRKLEKKKSGDTGEATEDGGPPEKIEKYDGPFFHCGNLPKRVDENQVKAFFAREGVDLRSVSVRRDVLRKKSKQKIIQKGKKDKLESRKGTFEHCYAIIQGVTEKDSKTLQTMNGSMFTSRHGTETHKLTIYPMLNVTDTEEKPCVYIKLGFKIEDQELFDFFTTHHVKPGKVLIARRGVNRVSKGNAFAWFKRQEDMEKAIKLSGTDLQGFKLDISQANSKKKEQHPCYKIGSVGHKVSSSS